ncbi:hypothetical protein [Endozoicomonas sp. YOMI1]|uniref:hypothetical protein n=1 Tax=Endozoicomonas sp. YOMI1 TaxID=2828739 RepID=UPI0021484739|nr:hypothetical protein [Endozoicomonas sp. YOMI1]
MSKDERIKEQLHLWSLLYPKHPLAIGLKIKVDPENEYAAEWQGEFVITGISIDHHHRINITIADNLTDGGYDGWGTGDLMPVF